MKSTIATWLRSRRGAGPQVPETNAAGPDGESNAVVGGVQFGDLRRVTPIGRAWGYDRGTPVDRHYIERFLEAHSGDVRGTVLEVGDDGYARQFGGDRVTHVDVLHVRDDAPGATIVADLSRGDGIESSSFDCVILTQTLHLIYDVRAALATLERILKPGGVLLATFPGISQIDRGEWKDSWYWSFTRRSAERLFGEVFGEGTTIESHGNVLAAVAFLHGLAAEELLGEELDVRDDAYELVITARVEKSA